MTRSQRLTGLALLMLITAACGPQPQTMVPPQEPTQAAATATAAAPTQTAIPATAAPVAAPFSVRAMAYNIEFGAGVGSGGANRLNDLIKLVQQANPDLLGIEEANGWAGGSPSAAQKFAEALGMTYYLAPAPGGMDNVLFSKFPILEGENLSQAIGDVGALRAVVELPGGQKLNVVVVHLTSGDNMTVVQPCQFDRLRRIMEAHGEAAGILMGDVNSHANDPQSAYLTAGGWELAQYEGVDSLYVRSAQEWKRERVCFWRNPSNGTCINDMGISDHLPVAAVVSFGSLPNPLAPAAAATPAAPEGCP